MRRWTIAACYGSFRQSASDCECDWTFHFFASLLRISVFGLGALIFGMHAATERNSLYVAYLRISEEIQIALAQIGDTSLLTPDGFLQPARRAGEGVTVNMVGDDGALVLLSGFFDGSNEVRLVRRDGTPEARWKLVFSDIFPDRSLFRHPPATEWNFDTHGALALPDGSVLVVLEYFGLVKLDRCGDIIWTRHEEIHHSVEQAEAGGYWTGGRRLVSVRQPDFFPFSPPYLEDLILRIDVDGTILKELSIPRIMVANGLDALFTANGEAIEEGKGWNHELVHANKITELPSNIAEAFPNFSAGDLAISLRRMNLVMVLDPDAELIKWHRVGPWRCQHDPEFDSDGTITIFNNNTYKNHDVWANTIEEPPRSNILRINPTTDQISVAYGDEPGQELFSTLRGKHELLAGGGFLITEFEGKRVIQTDAAGRTVWEYINRHDETRVAEITEARLYTSGYFDSTDWNCQSSPQLAMNREER